MSGGVRSGIPVLLSFQRLNRLRNAKSKRAAWIGINKRVIVRIALLAMGSIGAHSGDLANNAY